MTASGGSRSTLALAVAAFTLLLDPTAAFGATIEVDGVCTLIDAIESANQDRAVGGCAAGSGSDTIELATDVVLDAVHNVEVGANGTPAVRSWIEVDGRGHSVSRSETAPQFRLFYVVEPGFLSIKNLELSHGDSDVGGGAVRAEPRTDLILRNTTFTTNLGPPNQVGGGAVSAFGRVIIADSTFTGNRPGAIFVNEFGAPPELKIARSTILSGSGSYSSIWTAAEVAPLIASSTIVGGTNGVETEANLFEDRPPAMVNTTVTSAGNSGLENGESDYGGRVLFSTLTDNQHGIRDFNYIPGRGLGVLATISAYNTLSDCGVGRGHENVSTDGSGCPDATAISGFDRELTDNGGPTLTHALLPGSSAIDRVTQCAVRVDQRGYVRSTETCDAGAFEFGAEPPEPLSLTLTGSCPGEVTATVAGALPVSEIQFYAGPGGGTWIVDDGGCIGSVLDLYELLGSNRVVSNAEG